MSWKLSRTVLRRGKGSNPFSLVEFTSDTYINILKEADIKISMDHRGRCFDNIFIERLWRNLKYEKIYINELNTPRDVRIAVNEYFDFYNFERPHQSLEYKTPADMYFNS